MLEKAAWGRVKLVWKVKEAAGTNEGDALLYGAGRLIAEDAGEVDAKGLHGWASQV